MTSIALTDAQIDKVLEENTEVVLPPPVVEPKPKPEPPPPTNWTGEVKSFGAVFGESQDLYDRRAFASKKNIPIRTKDGFAFRWYYKQGRKVKFTLVGHPVTRGGQLRISTSLVPGDYETQIQLSGGDYGKINTVYGDYDSGWYWCSVSLTPESWPAASAQGWVGVEMQYMESNL